MRAKQTLKILETGLKIKGRNGYQSTTLLQEYPIMTTSEQDRNEDKTDREKRTQNTVEKWRNTQHPQIKPERTTLQKRHAHIPTVEGIGKRTPHNDAGHDRKWQDILQPTKYHSNNIKMPYTQSDDMIEQ